MGAKKVTEVMGELVWPLHLCCTVITSSVRMSGAAGKRGRGAPADTRQPEEDETHQSAPWYPKGTEPSEVLNCEWWWCTLVCCACSLGLCVCVCVCD